MQIVAYWSTLMDLARNEAKARKSGDAEALEIAKARHEDYRQICLRPDVTLILPGSRGDIY